MAALKTVVGNTAPQYQITCARPDGTVINLTSCTVKVYLYLNKTQQNTGHESSTVSIINPLTGAIGWQPATGDFSLKGQYRANIEITYPDASIEVLYDQAIFQVRSLI
jgi:hypothetical protein